jgi:hypothetical protein
MHFVFLRKTLMHAVFVLPDALMQIACHTDIQGAIPRACKNIDSRLLLYLPHDDDIIHPNTSSHHDSKCGYHTSAKSWIPDCVGMTE